GAGISDPTAGLDPLGVGDAEPWPGAPSGASGLLGGAVASTHEVVYFARNRFYSPGLNRWTAADPNAMGVPVLGAEWWGGEEPWVPAAEPDSLLHYRDGMNVHAAHLGNPLSISDPLGLFGLASIGIGSTTAGDLYSDHGDRVNDVGGSIQERAARMLADVAFDQTLDFFWASDWDSPDDLYRGSASWATRTGSWAIDTGPSPVESMTIGPALASGHTDALRHAVANARTDARGLGVYFVYDKAGNIIYAGRSRNMQSRMAQSMARAGGASVEGFRMTSRSAVRALEQVAIEHYDLIKNGKNSINGISEGNKKRNRYFKALERYAKKLK
ncbi:MAG: hypothetical protein K2Q20_00995, partial [Phycisphaerales bacterium]|nr:hypothetical protein [Phycisphaerales bacterium]